MSLAESHSFFVRCYVGDSLVLRTSARISNSGASNAPNSGALTVAGGVGVAANSCVGGSSIAFSGVTAGAYRLTGTTSTTDFLPGGNAGQLLYQGASGVTCFLTVGGIGQVLVSQGAAPPVYRTVSTLNFAGADFAAVTCNISGGLPYNIACQSNVNCSGFLTNGTSGQYLCSDGSSIYWVTCSFPAQPTAMPAGAGGQGRIFGYTTVTNELTAIGYCAGNILTTGQRNLAIGYKSLVSNTTGLDNIAVGAYGLNANTSGSGNIALGSAALCSNTIGSNNIAVGGNALGCNVSGNRNIAISNFALFKNSTGNNNIAIGAFSLCGNTSGSNNLAIGTYALTSSTYGSTNVAIGWYAQSCNLTGSSNIGIGYAALYRNISGVDNVAIGNNAQSGAFSGAWFHGCNNINIGRYAGACQYGTCDTIAIGSDAACVSFTKGNIVFGLSSFKSNFVGQDNIVIGTCAAYGAGYGSYNTIVGYNALCTLNGEHNVAFGSNIGLYACHMGFNVAIGNNVLMCAGCFSYRNVAIGTNAGYGCIGEACGVLGGISTKSRNVMIGYYAMAQAVHGSDNVAIGPNALCRGWFNCNSVYINSTGALYDCCKNEDIAIGSSTLRCNITGCRNIAIGYGAMNYNCFGSFNLSIGFLSLQYGQSGQTNIAIGANSSRQLFGSSCNNIAIGHCSLRNGCNNIENIAIGACALMCMGTSTACNIAIGSGAGCGINLGRLNTGIGVCTLNSGAGDASCNIVLGFCNMTGPGTGCCNISLGVFNFKSSVCGHNNIAIGHFSLRCTATGHCNIAIGAASLALNVTGCANIAIGNRSLYGSLSANNNIAIGCGALSSSITYGPNSVAIGNSALQSVIGGFCTTIAIGNLAGAYVTCPKDSVFIGALSGYGCTIGGVFTCPIGVFSAGWYAGCSNARGHWSIAIGANALQNNISGNYNVAIGKCSSYGLICGNSNIALGCCAMKLNRTSCCNIAIGQQTLNSLTSGFQNIAIGTNAMNGGAPWNGIGSLCCAIQNVAIGSGAFGGSTSTQLSIAIGQGAGSYAFTPCICNAVLIGSYTANCLSNNCCNVVIGESGLYCARGTGVFNIVSIGTQALFCACDCNNTAIGNCALRCGASGAYNTAIGENGLLNSFCNCLTSIGDCAGMFNYGGKNNTFVGWCASGSDPNISNVITLGNTDIACIRSQVSTITAFSDCRDKTNICSIPVGLEFVRALRPVKFEWNQRNAPNDGKRGTNEAGFIAQELDQAVQQFNAKWLNLVNTDNPDRLEATPGRLLPILIKTAQELSERNQVLRSKIETLEKIL